MQPEVFILYTIIFLYGIVIGSFLNVCIYRMPKNESLVVVGSHCMKCNHSLKWYDLFPLFSWLFLRGRCRYCGCKISAQYPIVEFINGVGYCGIIFIKGFNAEGIIYCCMFSVLVVLSVVDYRTMLIPTILNVFILVLGLVHLAFDYTNWSYYLIGCAFCGLFLFAIAMLFRGITGKGGLGLGDVELMACAGMCIGWGHGLFAIIIGSVLGIVVECIKMAVTKEKGKFPFGPYLSLGIMISVLWGDKLFEMYMNML